LIHNKLIVKFFCIFYSVVCFIDLLSLLKRCVCPAEHYNIFKDMTNKADALIANGFTPLTEVSMCIAIVFFWSLFFTE
jgi:hypothetical protein